MRKKVTTGDVFRSVLYQGFEITSSWRVEQKGYVLSPKSRTFHNNRQRATKGTGYETSDKMDDDGIRRRHAGGERAGGYYSLEFQCEHGC